MSETAHPPTNDRPKQDRFLANTAGELERESRSRRFNVIEAFLVMTILLITLWYVQYPFGILRGIEIVNTATTIFFVVAALYCLFVSPFLHRDTLHSWGLGNPLELWRTLKESAGLKRGVLVLVLALMTGGLCFAFYVNWPSAARLLFGVRRDAAQAFQSGSAGPPLVFLLGLALSLFFTTCVVRYNNFVSAFITALKIILVLGGALYAAAFAVMGPSAFSDFQGTKFALDVFGYVFWGAIQQLLFCSYFGTRLRKGFAPATLPGNMWKMRLFLAVLNGAFFGIIHINSWLLVAVCWLLGAFLSWVFMEDRNRNLIALGFIHGFLGSSVGWLFNREKAGGFRMNMGVGPAHMDGFDLLTVVVITLLIAAFVAFMVWALIRWRKA